MRKLIGLLLVLLALPVFADDACQTDNLGDFLDHENPRVIAYLRSLETAPSERQISGFRLCNGDTLFKGWSFLGVARALRPGQHVYLFTHGKAFRAVAWVESGAPSLFLPSCPPHLDCRNQPEGRNDVAGEVFTFKYLSPGEGPIILMFPLRTWFPA